MSTRATIKIRKRKQNDYWLYHHHDGYPEAVGKELKDYLLSLNIWDPEYIAGDLIERDLGYELTTGQHGDEEFAYLIDCDKKEIRCYRVGWDEFDWDESKLVEIP